MNDCKHPDFAAFADVNRLFENPEDEARALELMPDGFSLELRVHCTVCDEPFVFFAEGLPVGLVRDRPAINPDGTELRCPIRPQSADPLHGLGLAGFVTRVERGGGSSVN